MKRCSRCGQEKLETEFSKDRSRRDGLQSCCKACDMQYARAYEARYPKKKAASTKAWFKSERGKEQNRGYKQKSRASGLIDHQIKARRAVDHELKMGKLVRLPCVICRDPKSHGHHEDYDKPLDVVWLCPKHHKARHKEIDAEQKTAS